MMPIQAGDVTDLVENLGYKPATPIQEGICRLSFLDIAKMGVKNNE